MSSAAAAATAGGTPGGLPTPPTPPSLTECRAVGVVEQRQEAVHELAHLLRSLCASYSLHATHTAVLRAPLPPPATGGAPPGGTFTAVRLVRRLARSLPPAGHGGRDGGGGSRNPFLEDPPERWDVRHEGPPLQGPALNALPASMREVAEAGCWGAGALEFWKALGAKLEYDIYREGNEYNIVFHGHEIKVVLATVYSLNEPGVLRDHGSVTQLSPRLVAEASLLVPEGRHYEGASLLGAFAAQLAAYVKLGRAEAPPAGAAGAAVARPRR